MATTRYKRVVLYLDPLQYQQIQAVLSVDGISFSGWVRKKVKTLLAEKLKPQVQTNA